MAVPARPVECVDIQENDMGGLFQNHPRTSKRLRVVNVGYVNFTVRFQTSILIQSQVSSWLYSTNFSRNRDPSYPRWWIQNRF
jgi:hypothetical protein